MTAATTTATDVPRAQDDLFRHVNGEWLATAVIPDDRSMDGAFYTLRDGAEADSRAIVEDAAAAAARGEAAAGTPAQLIGDLYRSFMDTDDGGAARPGADHRAARPRSTRSPTPRACSGCSAGCAGTGSAGRSCSTSTATRPSRIGTC